MKLAGLLLPLLLAACGNQPEHVAGPFWLTSPEVRNDTALFRCIDGSSSCARDDFLPGPIVFAAGGDARHVVIARHPRDNSLGSEQTNWNKTEYFWFARLPTEMRGWGANPETVHGPLNEAEFEADKEQLSLPEFTVVLEDLDRSDKF